MYGHYKVIDIQLEIFRFKTDYDSITMELGHMYGVGHIWC